MSMHAIAVELDQRLRSLDAKTAASVEKLVHDALGLAEQSTSGSPNWPTDFWQRIRTDLGSEPMERPPQGDFENREPL